MEKEQQLTLKEEVNKQLDHLIARFRTAYFFNRQYNSLNKKVKDIINSTKKSIEDLKLPHQIFFRLAYLEKTCCNLINEMLTNLDKNKKISQISSEIKVLNNLNQVIKNINLTLSKHIDSVIADGIANENHNPLWEKLDKISQNIIVDTSKIENILKFEAERLKKNYAPAGNADSAQFKKNYEKQVADNIAAASNNLRTISHRAAKFILTSMIKEMHFTKGEQFINQLDTALGDAKIYVEPGVSGEQSGMAVQPVDVEGSFAIVENNKGSESSLENRTKEGVMRSKGGRSSLNVPITLSVDNFEGLGQSLGSAHIVDDSLSILMSGSFSFNEKLSYIPFQVELFHELIHVLHNAQGNNYRHVPLSHKENELWETYEEYITIKGGDICESDFVLLYGAIPRKDHHGVSANVLLSESGRNEKKTMNEIIREYIPSTASFDSRHYKEAYKKMLDGSKKEEISADQEQKRDLGRKMP